MSTTKKPVWGIDPGIITACTLGFAASYYAYIVETTAEKEASYEAMCDISEHVSCSKIFASEYGKGFGIIPESSVLYMPNSVYGLIFYIVVAILSTINKYSIPIFVVWLGFWSNIGTVYLTYILYKLNNICVVCVSTYFINAIILILAIKKYRKLFQNGTNKNKKKKKLN
ncbi:vitamin-K epoxide reductase [Ptiloglossa arizonensis]|uniref:vitamin-K epoxide reductase n=1 Tax=Ptiloglossa arizonensis TaxID=3350558 RepID=UPI003FA183F1